MLDGHYFEFRNDADHFTNNNITLNQMHIDRAYVCTISVINKFATPNK